MSEIDKEDAAPFPTKPLKPILDGHDRFTAVLNVHYEHKGDKPVQVRSTFSNLCSDKEEPYSRRFKVDDLWREIDRGWLSEKSGHIVIQNLQGVNPAIQPSPQEKEETAKHIIRISIGHKDTSGDTLDVPPGTFQMLRTKSKVYLRCDPGLTAQCKVHVFPE